MQGRTDLALEQHEIHKDLPNGVKVEKYNKCGAKVTKIEITNEDGAAALSKPIGTYLTVEVPTFSDNTASEEITCLIKDLICSMLPKSGNILAVGLGNKDITPDALGPKTAEKLLATRHVCDELKRISGVKFVRGVSVITPGVLGQTGIEAFDTVKGVTEIIKPAAVICIDALASRRLKRLGCTVQISNTGIEPGAGVGNSRFEISQNTLGIPVIALGVPTVVDAVTLVSDFCKDDFSKAKSSAEPDGRQMIVTPREIDLLTDRASKLLSDALNIALQPEFDLELIHEMMS